MSAARTTGRFAPTPSGDLHLGNLRTAMLAWCWARHSGAVRDGTPGRFLVRVEDLTTGAAPRRVNEQLEDLASIGITGDEPVPPQSARSQRYDAVIDVLGEQGLTYPCFCTRREIREAPAAPHGPSLEGAYPGTCASLSPSVAARRVAAGQRAALRLRAERQQVTVRDDLLGETTEIVDDFVLRRGDGLAAYNLAVVVDDADQGVTQVVRGEDLWHTTARQVLLQQLLGLARPQYVHVPLVHGPDGERLSKRHGAVTLRECLAAGETVGEVLGRLAASVGLAEVGESVDIGMVLERFEPAALLIAQHLPPPAR